MSARPHPCPDDPTAGTATGTPTVADGGTGTSLAGSIALRSRIATAVWLVAVVCALFLAVGALLVALRMNQQDAVVGFVEDGANHLDLGVLKQFTGKDAAVRSALTSWGIAAVLYLVAGKVLDRVIRP